MDILKITYSQRFCSAFQGEMESGTVMEKQTKVMNDE